MTDKEEQNRRRTDPEVIEGSTSRIRAVVERAEPADEAASTIEQIRAVQKGMKKKDRREVIDAALTKYFKSEMLKPYQQEALAKSLLEYEEAMAYSLDFSFAGFNLGNLYARMGEAQKAEMYYRTAIDIDGLFIPARANLAVLLNSLGRNEEAEVQLRAALDAEPEAYDLAYSLGLLLGEMGLISEQVGLIFLLQMCVSMLWER